MSTSKATESKQKIGPIGEVIASSITSFVAAAHKMDGQDGLPEPIRPNFGSFVLAQSSSQHLGIVSVVYDVVTGPQDSTHRTTALGLTREQLKLEQPHIFALLKTEFHAVTVGYFQNEKYMQHLPPHPPQVHDFIYCLDDNQVKAATKDLDFLRLLFGIATVPADELIAAVIRRAYEARQQDYNFLVAAGQALSLLYRDDYDRLLSLLKKIRPG